MSHTAFLRKKVLRMVFKNKKITHTYILLRNYVRKNEVAFAYCEQIPDPKKFLQDGTEVLAQ